MNVVWMKVVISKREEEGASRRCHDIVWDHRRVFERHITDVLYDRISPLACGDVQAVRLQHRLVITWSDTVRGVVFVWFRVTIGSTS